MFKQFLAERTVRFRYTPVDRSYTPLDDVDAVFHFETEESVGAIGRIICHRSSDTGVYSHYGAAATRFHGFVHRNLEPEITVSVSLDGTLRFWDFNNRWFFKEPDVANRFREYRKDTILEFDGFFDPEDVSVFPLVSQRFETDFELVNVLIPQVRECRFEVFNCFEHRLLSNDLWCLCQPFFVFKKHVVLGRHKRIAKGKLIVLVCFVVDGRYTRVISEPRRSGEFIQHQFLGFRGVDFYLPRPHHPF